MSQFRFINLDSKDASYSTSQTYNSYTFTQNTANELPNAFNAEWTFRTPIFGAKRMWLKSIELPIGFCNVRKSNGSNRLTVSTSKTIGVNEFSITLSEAVYTDISTLLTDINAAFAAAYPATSFVFSIKSTGISKGHVQVVSTTYNNGATVLYFRPGVLANDILGFDKTYLYSDQDYQNAVNATTVAKGFYMLNPDNYLNMYIPNISSADSNINAVPCSFKIPLTQINGMVMFSASNLNFDSYIPLDNVQVINKLQIIILDRWGYNINSRGLDYCITFAFEMKA